LHNAMMQYKTVLIHAYTQFDCNGEVPLRLLAGYGGYLQVDGYTGYNAVCKKNGIIQLGCWDHARRYFKEAHNAQPKPKKGKITNPQKQEKC